MKKESQYTILKVFTIVFVFLNSISHSQEIIPLSTRTGSNITVKGDMAIIGNTILGVSGPADRFTANANEPYNFSGNNGKGQHRGFIDIDSNDFYRNSLDANPDTPGVQRIFSPSFLSNSVESEYSGNLNADGNGAPTTCSSSENGTFSSSSSFLDLNQECSTVVKAFLYWAGTYSGETRNDELVNPRINSCADGNALTNASDDVVIENFTEIKILPPTADRYYDISANPSNTTGNPNAVALKAEVIIDGLENRPYNNVIPRGPRGGNPGDAIKDEPYVCVADVTNIFTELQRLGQPVNGFWTVANVRATTGRRRGQGLTGGWTLAVIYEDPRPSVTNKAFSFFDGFSIIKNGQAPVSFKTPTFQSIPNGPIVAWIASANLEGDQGISGDRFSIQTETTKSSSSGVIRGLPVSAIPMRETPSDNTNNFFNSTITNLKGNTLKYPNSTNTLGYDTDHFKLDNKDNSIINNGFGPSGGITDTDAKLYLSTNSDSYYNFFNAFAIEVIAPDISIIKQSRLIALGPDSTNKATVGNLLPSGSVIGFGDIIQYEMIIRNIGNDIAEEIVFEDLLPANTELLISQFTDPADFSGFDVALPTVTTIRETITDRASVTYETDKISLKLPDLGAFTCANQPSDPNTGRVITEPKCGGEVTIRFRVKVVEECSANRNACVDSVENTAFASFEGRFFQGDRFEGRESAFGTDSTCEGSPIVGPTILVSDALGKCSSQVTEICTGNQTLTSGLGFQTYSWYFVDPSTSGPIVDQNGNGIVDDADYDISDGVFLRTLRTGVDPNPNSFLVNRLGYYIVIQEGEPLCTNSRQTFNVVDGSVLISNPFKDATLNPSRQDAETACSIDGEQITRFILCDTNLVINTNYSDGTTLVWDRYVNGSCTRPAGDNNCPFIGDACGYQNVLNSTVSAGNPATSQFDVNETGSFRLTVTEGGCTNIFYFDTVKIESNLRVPILGTFCGSSANAQIDVAGLTPDGIGINYELDFLVEDIDNPGTFISQETQVASDPNYGSFTLNTPTPFRELVNIKINAVPDLSDGIDASACTFTFDRSIRFSQPVIEVFEFSREPSCSSDQALTAFDDTLADISVRASAGLPNYFFQLINTNGTSTNIADDTVVATFGPVADRQHTFTNVDPKIEYKVRVFANSEGATLPTVALDNSQCQSEQGPIQTAPLPTLKAIFSIEKEITCTAGEILIEIESSDPTLDLSAVDFELNAFNTTTGTSTLIIGGTGASTAILIDDVSQQPALVDEGSPGSIPDDGVNYVDIDSFDQFTITISSSDTCVNPELLFPNSFEEYSGIQLVEDNVVDINCAGSTDGSISVIPQELNGTAYPTSANVAYEIVSGPTGLDPLRLNNRQPDRLFTNLPVGNYEIIVIDITDTSRECISLPLPLTIEECTVPDPVPGISISLALDEVAQPTCVNQFGTIKVSATGGTPPYTFELTEAAAPTTVIATNTSGFFDSDLLLLDGVYTVSVTDSRSFGSTSPLAPITIESPNNPTVDLQMDTIVNCPDNVATLTATAMEGGAPSADISTIEYTLLKVDDALGNNPIVVQGSQMSGTFINVQPGEFGTPNFYIASIIDGNGCPAISSVVTVENPEPISIGTELVIDITCDDSRAVRRGNPVRTAQYLINPTGGGSGSTFTIDLLSGNPLREAVTVVESNSTGVFELETGANFIRVTNNPNGCEAFTTINVTDSPKDIQIAIESSERLLCPGQTGDVSLLSVRGGLVPYVYELFIVTQSGSAFTEIAGPLDGTTTPIATRVNETQFLDLVGLNTLTASGSIPANATYAYKVSSQGMCEAVYEPFEIRQRDPIDYTIVATEISCQAEEDGIITVTVNPTNGVGPFTVTIIPEEGVTGTEIADSTINATSVFDINNQISLNIPVGQTTAQFMNLAPSDYRVLISDVGSGCNVSSDLGTVQDKQGLLVTEASRSALNCRGDNGGVISFNIESGTAPYFYQIIENRDVDSTPEPSAEEVLNNGVQLGTAASTSEILELSDLDSEVNYEIFIVDSGNRQTGTDLRICEPKLVTFSLNTPDLNQFTATATPDCPGNAVVNGTYTINITNNNLSLEDSLITYVATRVSDGAVFTSNTNSNQITNVPDGTYGIVLRYEASPSVFCESNNFTGLEALNPFVRVQFERDLTTNAMGSVPFVPKATSNINVYQLEAVGGQIAPGDFNPYLFSGTFVKNAADDSNFADEILINPDGTFEVLEGGWYTFKVTDKFNDDCFDFVVGIPIDFMDVRIPNVFNPSSSNPGTSTFFPDNITINSPDGEVVTTTTIITTGGVTDISGITTGGITTVTTTRAGITSTTVTTGTTVVGGNVGPNGVVTGGTITGGNTPMSAFAEVVTVGGITTITIVTGGTTTGGTKTGGETSGSNTETSGGTTSATVNGDVINGGSTTGGTNVGGSTEGGVITDATISVITIDASGPIVQTEASVTTGVTITGATLIGGETTGGTTTGGVTKGGNSNPDPDNPDGTIITGGVTMGGVTTGGTTIGGVVVGGTISGGVTTTTANVGETIITEGGDDVFFDEFSNMVVQIYDRYGRLLKESVGLKDRRVGEGWDGTYNGNEMPSGDYWFHIELNDKRKREFTGHFTLYRK